GCCGFAGLAAACAAATRAWPGAGCRLSCPCHAACARRRKSRLLSWKLLLVRLIWYGRYSERSQEARSQFLHDLVGAAIDTLHTRIGPQAGDRVFLHVAVATE